MTARTVTESPRVMPSAHMSPREGVWLAGVSEPCAEGSPKVLMGKGSARLLQADGTSRSAHVLPGCLWFSRRIPWSGLAHKLRKWAALVLGRNFAVWQIGKSPWAIVGNLLSAALAASHHHWCPAAAVRKVFSPWVTLMWSQD